jgi:hypothetical protein
VKAFELALSPQKAPFTSVIKRYQIDYSYEQKYKLGILTPAEYYAWQREIFMKDREEQEKRSASDKVSHTFWENDKDVRRNVSSDDYNEFLTLNNLDVRNENDLDIDALLKAHGDEEQGAGVNAAEPAAEAVGAAASDGALPGDDDPNRVLTPEEIAALFAAMGTG